MRFLFRASAKGNQPNEGNEKQTKLFILLRLVSNEHLQLSWTSS